MRLWDGFLLISFKLKVCFLSFWSVYWRKTREHMSSCCVNNYRGSSLIFPSTFPLCLSLSRTVEGGRGVSWRASATPELLAGLQGHSQRRSESHWGRSLNPSPPALWGGLPTPTLLLLLLLLLTRLNSPHIFCEGAATQHLWSALQRLHSHLARWKTQEPVPGIGSSGRLVDCKFLESQTL